MCDATMEIGALSLSQTFWGFLAAGSAMPHLFFQASSGGQKISVFSWKSDLPTAWHCSKCGTLIIQGYRKN